MLSASGHNKNNETNVILAVRARLNDHVEFEAM